MRRLLSVTFCSQTLSPLWNVNFRKCSGLRLSNMSFLKPFLHLSVCSHKNRIQFGLLFPPLNGQILIHSKDFCCLNGIFKVLPDKLLVIRCPVGHRTIFRRIGRTRYITFLIVTPVKRFVPEVCNLFHGWIQTLQKFFIFCVKIVFIGIQKRPCRTNGIPSRRIVLLSHGNKHIWGAETAHQPAVLFSFFTLDTKSGCRCFTSCLSEYIQIILIRKQTFSKITCHGRPVIHLYINIKMVISAPFKMFFSPHTLKVGRKRPFSGTGNGQVTSKLITDYLHSSLFFFSGKLSAIFFHQIAIFFEKFICGNLWNFFLKTQLHTGE